MAKQLLSLSQASFINQTKFIHPFTLGLLYLSLPASTKKCSAAMYHPQACTQSLEELTKLGVEDEEVDVEEEEEEEANELSTISEEQGEL